MSWPRQKRTFAFESTLAARHYAGWIRRLLVTGYSFQLIFLWLRSPELAVYQVDERVRSGGHEVPGPVIHRRYVAGLKNFWDLYQPLANAWAVYDNSLTPEPVSIASGEKDRPTCF